MLCRRFRFDYRQVWFRSRRCFALRGRMQHCPRRFRCRPPRRFVRFFVRPPAHFPTAQALQAIGSCHPSAHFFLYRHRSSRCIRPSLPPAESFPPYQNFPAPAAQFLFCSDNQETEKSIRTQRSCRCPPPLRSPDRGHLKASSLYPPSKAPCNFVPLRAETPEKQFRLSQWRLLPDICFFSVCLFSPCCNICAQEGWNHFS